MILICGTFNRLYILKFKCYTMCEYLWVCLKQFSLYQEIICSILIEMIVSKGKMENNQFQ